jgi:hypothetical protein
MYLNDTLSEVFIGRCIVISPGNYGIHNHKHDCHDATENVPKHPINQGQKIITNTVYTV